MRTILLIASMIITIMMLPLLYQKQLGAVPFLLLAIIFISWAWNILKGKEK